nr:4Fe-4S binding protein [Clostridioides sp.]
MYNFLGKELKSPFIIGSGPLTYSAYGCKILSDAGAGAVVTKTIRKSRAINPAPHMVRITNNALINNEKWTDFEPEQWIDYEIPQMKKDGTVCIASVGHTLEESSELVEKIEKAGADFIELVSYDYNDLIPMLKDAKSKVNIPVIVKLPPMVDDIANLCKALEEAGADAITACDSVGPAFRIDIETGRPLLGGDGFGWLSGEVIKPITLHKIYEIRQKVSIPIIGLGGCVNGDDALEMVIAGADFVGICSVVILKGADVISKIHRELNTNLDRLGYGNIENARGIVHKHMGTKNEKENLEFTFDEDKCVRCKMCEKVCTYHARKLNEKMELNEKECRYCGLCISVCKPKALGRKLEYEKATV